MMESLFASGLHLLVLDSVSATITMPRPSTQQSVFAFLLAMYKVSAGARYSESCPKSLPILG